MKYSQKRKIKSGIFLVLAAAAVCGLFKRARASSHFRSNSSSELTSGEVRVAKGETLDQDITASGPILIEGILKGDCVSLGGPVSVRGKILGDLTSLGGPVTVTGYVKGDVSSLGGPVKISGRIEGDIASMGGDVTLGDKAFVLGDVALMGGRLDKSNSAILKGNISRMDWGLLGRFGPLLARYGRNGSWEKISLAYRVFRCAAFLFFTAGIGLMLFLLAVFFPKQIERVAVAVRRDFWKSAGIGALILMLISPGLFLMLVSVLGIPLIPMAILLLCAAVLMSLAALSLIATEKFYLSLKKSPPGILTGVLVGYLILTGLMILGKLIGVLGDAGDFFGEILIFADLMVLGFVVMTGLGAVWMTRMGSRAMEMSASLSPMEGKN